MSASNTSTRPDSVFKRRFSSFELLACAAAAYHRQGRISFAAGLHPLEVSAAAAEHESSGVFRTCALIAATPHAPVNRKLVTDRCSSHVIPRPRTCSAAGIPPQQQQHGIQADRCATAPQASRARGNLFAGSRAQSPETAAAQRASTAQSAPTRLGLSCFPGGPSLAAVPPVLQFEGWWLRSGPGGSRRKCSIHITYHTDTDPAAFFIRGDIETSSSRGRSPQRCASCGSRHSSSRDKHSGCAACGRAHASNEAAAASDTASAAAALPPQGAWLCVTGATGGPLDHWDLHVGAELSLLGRKVVIKRASCATMAWLDTWAKLLLLQQHSLEQQLAKFALVIPGQGLVRHSPQRSDWSSPGAPLTPTGGIVNLRHLREDVALLAARLRQHKADVRLPGDMQDLTPQGPVNWSLDSEPQVMTLEPFTPAPKHTAGTQPLQRQFSRHGNTLNRLPSLGTTPAGKALPSNANNLMSWLQGILLAASAAKSPYGPDHMQPPARLLDV